LTRFGGHLNAEAEVPTNGVHTSGRNTYRPRTPEPRTEAVRLVRESGCPPAQRVGGRPELLEEAIQSWLEQAELDAGERHDPHTVRAVVLFASILETLNRNRGAAQYAPCI
jgi:hypothetical protein